MKVKPPFIWTAAITLVTLIVQITGVNAQQRLGDNLGNHKATQNLNLNNKNIISAGGIAVGGSSLANSSVGLQIDGSKAMLLNRVTTLASVTAPVNGMMVYNTADNKIYVYQNSAWSTYGNLALATGRIFIGSSTNTVQGVAVSGDLTVANTGAATIGASKITSGTIADAAVNSSIVLDGEVKTTNIAPLNITTSLIANQAVTQASLASSAVTTAKIANDAVTPSKISSSTAGINKMLFSDASSNLSYVDNSTRILPVMTDGQIIVGNSLGVPTAVTMNGDVTIANTGVSTISTGSVTSAMIVDATIAATDIADNAVTADKINSATKGANKVLKTDAAGVAGWYDKTTNSNGYNVGDIKAYLPHLMGNTPSGWVDCNGQTLDDPASPLNGKVIPDLNNDSYLVGATTESGLVVGTNNRMLIGSNLPNVTLTGTLKSGSAGIPSGTVTLDAAGTHNHAITDPGHSHGVNTNPGGFNDPGRIQVSDRDIDGYITLPANYTGVTIREGGDHVHSSTFLGNSLGTHTHTGVISGDLNGTGTQTPINVRPNSVTVRWIMKIK